MSFVSPFNELNYWEFCFLETEYNPFNGLKDNSSHSPLQKKGEMKMPKFNWRGEYFRGELMDGI